MKRETIFLRMAVILIGTPVLAAWIIGLPVIFREAAESKAGFPLWLTLGFLGLYASSGPFFFALYQAFKLLRYIDLNQAFSALSIKALKRIRYCAIIISGFTMVDLPFFYTVADLDDAPGVMLLGLIITFAAIVIAVFAALLEQLLKNAVLLKSEHDLTV